MTSEQSRTFRQCRQESRLRDYRFWSRNHPGTFEEWRAPRKQWMASCRSDSLESVQHTHAILGTIGRHYWDKGLSQACCGGNLPVVQWIYTSHYHTLTRFTLRSSCLWAAESGQLETLQWLCSRLKDEARDRVLSDTLVSACSTSQMHVADWLRSLDDVDYRKAIARAWEHSCSRGHLEVVQWLWVWGVMNRDRASLMAWRHACSRGHIGILVWLSDENPPTEAAWVDGWTAACSAGKLDVAQWVWSRNPSHELRWQQSRLASGWRDACQSGSLTLIQWLWDMGSQIGGLTLESGWTYAADKCRSEVIIWMLEQGVDESLCSDLETCYPQVWPAVRAWVCQRQVKSARTAHVEMI